MTESIPQNIVEAYTQASKATMLNPKMKGAAFESVVDFCESDNQCRHEDTVKRNQLLFWSYNNAAISYFDDGNFDEALELWNKAKGLIDDANVKTDIGFKMLEAIERCRFTIPQKAVKIIEICQYLKQAYQQLNDSGGLQKMEHLQAAAEYLLGGSKLKN